MRYKSVKEENNKRYKRTILDEIKYYGFYIWWNYLDMLPRRIYWFFQRGYRGYGDCDIWDFDIYLANIISRGVKHLKKYHHGCPTDIYNKYKDRKDLTQTQKDKLAVKEWHTKLDTLIRGFELVPKLFEEKVFQHKTLRSKYMDALDRAFDVFRRYYFNLWD
jgi:hypothetical protein